MFVNNTTPFQFMALPNYDKDGREVFTHVVKATFSLPTNKTLEISKTQMPIAEADEFWGEPGVSPVKYESDLAVFKPYTDLVLLGSGYDYRERKIKRIEVAFGLVSKNKRVMVESAEERNAIPLVILEYGGKEKNGSASGRPQDGFGFYPKRCEPRMRFAGTYDENWRKERFPFVPADFDYRFFQAAYPELITDAHLKGNERLFAEHVSPQGPILIDLPGIVITVQTVFEKKRMEGQAMLDTVILEPDKRRLILVWRLLVPCQGLIPSVQGFTITMAGACC